MMIASLCLQSTSPINWYRSPSWNGKGEILEQSTNSMAELFLGSCIQTKFCPGSYLNNLPNVRIMTPCKPGATCKRISETGINLAGAAITIKLGVVSFPNLFLGVVSFPNLFLVPDPRPHPLAQGLGTRPAILIFNLTHMIPNYVHNPTSGSRSMQFEKNGEGDQVLW